MKPQELFNAHDRGEKIEVQSAGSNWHAWSGRDWRDSWRFRIVPKPKRTVLKYQALYSSVIGINFITTAIYKDDADAIETWGKEFIRLLTDRPIECEVQDE